MKKMLPEAILLAVLVLLAIFSPAPVLSSSTKPPKTTISDLEQEIATMGAHDLLMEQQIQQLYDRTEDLNARLKHFEDMDASGAGHDKAFYRLQAELNDVDARLAQLERPEVENEAK